MIPSLVGRMPLGKSESHPMAETGGSETVTLTTAQMPSHNHSVSIGTAGGHTHSSPSGTEYHDQVYNCWRNYPYGSTTNKITGTNGLPSDGSHTHTVSVGNSGSSQGHNNMPPYISLNMIIKT